MHGTGTNPSSVRSVVEPIRAASRVLYGAGLAAVILGATVRAQAQQPQAPPQARIVVIGEGNVTVPPDYAQIRGGVTTRAKTAKEASDANGKIMAAIVAALQNSGIERKDIQTSAFSVQPVYAQPQVNSESKLSGFSVSNQVDVKVRQIGTLGDIFDQLVTAGATNIGGVDFLLSDPSKALDQARTAALADARRKAELYAKAADLTLGSVVWITEDSGSAPPMPMAAMRGGLAPAPAPIAAGEDTLQVRITVGLDIAH
jgi:uncharacterized protein